MKRFNKAFNKPMAARGQNSCIQGLRFWLALQRSGRGTHWSCRSLASEPLHCKTSIQFLNPTPVDATYLTLFVLLIQVQTTAALVLSHQQEELASVSIHNQVATTD